MYSAEPAYNFADCQHSVMAIRVLLPSREKVAAEG
jgi:hypothetical protein